MSHTKRKCNNCSKEYLADNINLKRGWGLCCSKSCSAKLREKSKPGYNPETVKANNKKRRDWNKTWYKKDTDYDGYDHPFSSDGLGQW